MKIEKRHQEKLKELKQFFVFYGHCHVPRNSSFIDLYEWTNRIRQNRSKISETLRNELETMGFHWGMYDSRELLWQFRYEELIAFKNKYGHTKVTNSFKEYLELSTWVHGQRGLGKKIRIERKRLLDEIGFLWSSDLTKMNEDKWNRNYEKLKMFKEKNGHTVITKKYEDELGIWINVQREFEHKMSKNRKDLLNSIGFLWKNDLPAYHQKLKDDYWEDKFRQLIAFKKENGHVNHRAHSEREKKLGEWVIRQRKAKKNGKLSDNHFQQLNGIGLKWSFDYKKREAKLWLQTYNKLKAYQKEFGNCLVPEIQEPKNDKEKEQALLNIWVKHQRYRSKRLAARKKQLLNDINFEWKKNSEIRIDQLWKNHYQELAYFFKEFGHSKVPARYAKNKSLGDWVYRQRRDEVKLSKEQKEKLNLLNFVWRSDLKREKQKKWNERFKQLQLFYKKFVHSNVPANSKENPNLGAWVGHIRSGNLPVSPKQKEKLASLNFQWPKDILDQKDENWMKKYRSILAFKRKHGHARITNTRKGYNPLYGWVQNQRAFEKTMPKWRYELLDDIGFLWSGDLIKLKKQQWQKKYDELVVFYQTYGHSRVSERKNKRLGSWVSSVRKNKDKLDGEQIEKLGLVEFNWAKGKL